ncbi:MAG: hypothetical protein A4E23_01642 [Methanomethylovorans sp. PtaU1.Bin073]|jgi:hypothetical protein|nr:MAG: hypothetical protein A4E23_01642 [Methanomethylovorans sp. PtaU1.Bin073]
MNSECFELWSLASHPLVQQLANLDWETFETVYYSHPAVAHFIEASRELIEAAALWEVSYDCDE